MIDAARDVQAARADQERAQNEAQTYANRVVPEARGKAAQVSQAAEAFGGIDILINNASAINLTPTEATPAKRFDLMFDVNVRGTFLTSQAAIPHLRASA